MAPWNAVRASLVALAGLITVAGAVLADPSAAQSETAARDPAASQPELYDDGLVHDVFLTFASDNWLSLLDCARGGGPGQAAAPSRTDVPATLEVDGLRLEQVGVRCKGNSSLGISGSKKPLNISTNAFVPKQRLWGIDAINLDNNWSDPSQLRAAIALRLLREYLPSPRFSFARLTIQGQYIGLYTMTEQVDGQFANHWYPGDDGFRIKGDSPTRIAFNSSTLQFLGESLDSYRRQYEVKGRAAEGDEAYLRLREFTRALDASAANGGLAAADFPPGIREELDVETALWYLATSNLIANFDSYYVGKNYFMYVGEGDPRFHIIPWDLGLSFGLFPLQLGAGGRPGQGTPAARVSPFAQEADQNRPLIRRLLAVPEFRADYLAHYRAVLAETFTPEWIGNTGSRYQDLIRSAAREEEATQGRISGAFSYNQFVTNLHTSITGAGGPLGGTVPGILALVADRRAYLASLPELAAPDVALDAAAHEPTAPMAQAAVEVRASFGGSATIDTVQLRYRVDGGYEQQVPMVAEGGAWLATIPGQRQASVVSYVLRVGLSGGAAAFFPSATLTKPFQYKVGGVTLPRAETGDLVINELLADNKTTLADEAGEFDDWVELYNRGDQVIHLGGYFLSDKIDAPWAFALPDQPLGPGERLLIWCDNDTDQGPLHAGFALNKDGEAVFLSTQDATVDSVSFGPLGTDESLMRLPDGGPDWIVCTTATPNEANACGPEAIGTPTPELPETPTPTATPRQAEPTPSVAPTETSEATPSAPATRTPAATPAPVRRLYLPMTSR